MKQYKAFLCLLVLCFSGWVYGDAHTTDSDGKFSVAATWTGDSAPIAGDSFTISLGNTVRYDETAGTDYAGATINGTLTCGDGVGDANDYYLKVSGNITLGAGASFTIGTSAVAPLPQTATMTIDFDGTASGFSSIGAGATINFWCTEPTYKVITLSADEAAGQTELSVATDVTADIWAVGDTISICDLQGAQEHETRVIEGIAADHIHITAGLTANKEGGVGDEKCQILLCTRNIRIIAGPGATQVCFNAPVNATINAWGYCATAAQGYAVSASSGNTLGGYWGVGPTSAWTTGWSRLFTTGSNNTLSGTASGNTYVFNTSPNGTLSGTASGNTNVFYISPNGTLSGTASGNTAVFSTSPNGLLLGANISSGTYCWRKSGNCLAYNSTIATTTESYEFTSDYVRPDQWIVSYDHDAIPGAFRFFSLGGNTVNEDVTVPSGYTKSYQLTCASATYQGFSQEVSTIMPGKTLKVDGWMKQGADDMSAWPERIEIIDVTNTVLASDTVADADGSETGWQEINLSYKNTTALPMPVWVRASAKDADAVVYFAYKMTTEIDLIGIIQ